MTSRLLIHQIDEACTVISAGCNYLDRVITDQGFIADGSYTDFRLTEYAKRLREHADAIEKRRAALLGNEPVPFLQAAE